MDSSDIIYPIFGGIRGFILFPKGISTKVNVIARLEFELVYFEAAVHYISHCVTVTRIQKEVVYLSSLTEIQIRILSEDIYNDIPYYDFYTRRLNRQRLI